MDNGKRKPAGDQTGRQKADARSIASSTYILPKEQIEVKQIHPVRAIAKSMLPLYERLGLPGLCHDLLAPCQ